MRTGAFRGSHTAELRSTRLSYGAKLSPYIKVRAHQTHTRSIHEILSQALVRLVHPGKWLARWAGGPDLFSWVLLLYQARYDGGHWLAYLNSYRSHTRAGCGDGCCLRRMALAEAGST